MDTPTIAAYYKEMDPMKRKALLDQSIAVGEDPEGNALRQKIWEIRYKGTSSAEPENRADGFLGLWMTMEFNKDKSNRFWSGGRAKKEVLKALEKSGFSQFANGTAQEREMIYREAYHMISTYESLCEKDKTYGSTIFGIVAMKEKDLIAKIKADLFDTAIRMPSTLGLEEELDIIIQAAKAFFEYKFPEECPLPSPIDASRK